MRIWIEIITPKPENLPAGWMEETAAVVDHPHEAILLRWTSALKEKSNRLIGHGGYMSRGIVSPQDIFVIAVNSFNLRGASAAFPNLLGISQKPYAVEAMFGVGPLQLIIDRESRKAVDQRHQFRTSIQNANLSPVSTACALDLDNGSSAFYLPREVSAVWALDVNETIFLNKLSAIEVVHNLRPNVALPAHTLPSYYEHHCTESVNEWTIERVQGSLLDKEPI